MRVTAYILLVFCLNTMLVYSQHDIRIDATLNTNLNELNIKQQIIYKNTSNSTLHEIFLNDWANSFSSKTTPLAKRFAENYDSSFHFEKNENRGKSTIFSNTGVNELDNNPTFRMYPNPANTVAFIEANFDNNSEVQIKLVDMAGKEVASRDYGVVTAGSKLPINTSSLETGVYLVEVSINNVVMTQRLVVE